MPYPSYTQSQRFLATLLLFSFLLESCYNPNISMGKRAISPYQEVSGGNIYHEEGPYDNAREQRTTTTADNRPIESNQAASNSEQAQGQPGQQGAQAKGKERAVAVAIEEVSKEAAPPGPAIIPPLPLVTQPLSQADKAPQHTASQVFLAQGGGTGEPSGVDQHQGEPSTEKAQGSALSHDPPKGLELTKSRGATELERTQQEAARLKEKIAELYLALPQATEKAGAKVVRKLITHLKALLKLEGFCTLAQGSDGAKAYISRVREAHCTSWGQTAYGARISKQLTALLVQAQGQELGLKRLASDWLFNKTSAGVGQLLKVLGQLAAFDLEQVAPTGDLSYYTDAAILYQNILRICEKEQGYQKQIEAAYIGLAKIRRDMLAGVKGEKAGVVAQGDLSIAKLQEEIAGDKKVLKDLRADAKTRVDQLEALLGNQGSKDEKITREREFIEESKKLFYDIAKEVRGLLARLYQESEKELTPVLGTPPCKYTVIGLGSMALEQMTPYSDLEFAILMEKGTDEAREYLRHLTHLVHFRVLNLGETLIPKDKYDVNLDHLGKRGINFDLGGKTPLGRKDRDYDLIQTVEGMLCYLKDEGGEIEHIDKNLPYILESTRHVYGDWDLHSAYIGDEREFLSNEERRKARVLKRLKKDVIAFKPQLNIEDEGKLYDVKQEIYRLPDRLLHGLAMYYIFSGSLPKDGWGTVDALAGSEIIGAEEAKRHLQYAVSFATLLRLKTYLYYDQQREGVTMLKEVSEASLLPPEALQEGGSLFKYYYTALALHNKVESFCKANELQVSSSKAEEFFQEAYFYDAADFTKGLVHQRLLQYEQAIECYKREWASIDRLREVERPHVAELLVERPHVAKLLTNLGSALNQSGKPKEAIEYLEQALKIREKFYRKGHLEVASSLANLGSALNQSGKPNEAIKCYERALPLIERFYKVEQPHVAELSTNLGRPRGLPGNPKQAMECYKRVKDINEKFYREGRREVASSLTNLGSALSQSGKPNEAIECYERALKINVASSLTNLGSALSQLGKPNEAIECYERALKINKEFYGEQEEKTHLEVANSLINRGALNQSGKPNEAIECYERALEISEKSYRETHLEVASSLTNLGSAWYQLGDSQKAIEYYERAKAINEEFYGERHLEVASSLTNLGSALSQSGKPNEAIGYLERALKINEEFYGEQKENKHPEVASSLTNLGLALDQLGYPKKAIEYYERAKAINEKSYGEGHPEVARILNHLGLALDQLGDPKKAIEHFERTLSITEKVYGEEHPEVATVLNNLGRAWDKLGDPKKAIGYYERAKAIYKKAYEREHPEVAMTLTNLGSALSQSGKPNEAIGYLEQALKISKKFYGEEHPSVAMTLTNLGSALSQSGKPNEAIGYLERAKAINEKFYGEEHPSVATSLNNLGNVWDQLGEPKKASGYLERAKAIYERAYGSEHPEVAMTLNNLGSACDQLGEPQKASGYLEQAKGIIERVYGAEHPRVATILNNLGGVWERSRYLKWAIDCYKRALAINEKAYGQEHPEVATNLHNLGIAWEQLKDFKQALECHKRALAINEKVYGLQQPKDELGDPKQAMEYCDWALEIDEEF